MKFDFNPNLRDRYNELAWDDPPPFGSGAKKGWLSQHRLSGPDLTGRHIDRRTLKISTVKCMSFEHPWNEILRTLTALSAR